MTLCAKKYFVHDLVKWLCLDGTPNFLRCILVFGSRFGLVACLFCKASTNFLSNKSLYFVDISSGVGLYDSGVNRG